MREFELYGTVRAIVSVCDCMNYITEEEDLLTVEIRLLRRIGKRAVLSGKMNLTKRQELTFMI